MIQIKSETAIGTCFILALAGGLNVPAEACVDMNRLDVIVRDESTASTHASTASVQLELAQPALADDLLPLIGMALGSREVSVPADIAAVIGRNLHRYWD